MRESKFIKVNAEKWRRYEDGIKQGSLPPEDMESAFVELNDDLAYARTFYKNRAVRLFLNNLLTPVYSAIYKGKKWNWKKAVNFFAVEAPAINYSARYMLLVSFVAVFIGVCIGFFSTSVDREFASSILGSEYVRITEDNINRGDPLAIYKHEDAGDMFRYIALNNLYVAALFLFFGALFCVGTLYLLMYNGIVLGAFTWLFTSRGLTTEYLLTVYQHGTLEILGMVVEGAAGLMIGSGILFPGTLTRARSMQVAAKKAVTIFLVCVPVIILAAFIESFLTRFTEIHFALRISIILLSLLIMLYYFVIFPLWKFRNAKQVTGNYDLLEAEQDNKMEPGEIYKNNTILLLVFDFLKQHGSRILLFSISSVLVLLLINQVSGNAIVSDLEAHLNEWNRGGVYRYMDDTRNTAMQGFQWFSFNIYAARYFFSAEISNWIFIFNWIAIAGIVYFVLRACENYLNETAGVKNNRNKAILAAILCATSQVFINYLFESWWPLAMFFIFPFNLLICVQYNLNLSSNPIQSAVKSIGIGLNALGKMLGAIFIIAVLYFVIMFGINYLTVQLVVITRSFHGGQWISAGIMKFHVVMNYFLLPFFLVMVTYFFTLVATSLFEARFGIGLLKKVRSFSYKKDVYGVETE
ncbi:MAG: stage II sporulation protein M [Bacteroidetes bacterium]|nr:stage II sporulation protein M [Bacteroidota bacterium]